MGRQKGFVGHWDKSGIRGMIYRRRKTSDIPTFCGWDSLEGLIVRAPNAVIRGLISAAFETGGRAMEVLDLRENQFDIRSDRVYVNAMLVLKQREKRVLSYPWQDKTEYEYSVSIPKKEYRRVPLSTREPLAKILIEYVELVREKSSILPSRIQHNPEGYLFPYKYGWMYKWITATDPEWWPHRLRVERASQLVIDYNYNVMDLLRFFGWKSSEIATHYARLSVEDLLSKMSRGEL